jgi:hypothetical protein
MNMKVDTNDIASLPRAVCSIFNIQPKCSTTKWICINIMYPNTNIFETTVLRPVGHLH